MRIIPDGVSFKTETAIGGVPAALEFMGQLHRQSVEITREELNQIHNAYMARGYDVKTGTWHIAEPLLSFAEYFEQLLKLKEAGA